MDGKGGGQGRRRRVALLLLLLHTYLYTSPTEKYTNTNTNTHLPTLYASLPPLPALKPASSCAAKCSSRLSVAAPPTSTPYNLCRARCNIININRISPSPRCVHV